MLRTVVVGESDDHRAAIENSHTSLERVAGFPGRKDDFKASAAGDRSDLTQYASVRIEIPRWRFMKQRFSVWNRARRQ